MPSVTQTMYFTLLRPRLQMTQQLPRSIVPSTTQVVKLGERMVLHAYSVLNAERLRATHSPRASTRSAWPAMLFEAGDSTVSDKDTAARRHFTASEVQEAWRICETFADLDAWNEDKKIAITKACTKWSWAKIAKRHGLGEWWMARRICDALYAQLVHSYQLRGIQERARQI